MNFATLYRKSEEYVYYFSLWMPGTNVVCTESGNLTSDRSQDMETEVYPDPALAESYATHVWKILHLLGWKTAQELGINSNLQSYTPVKSTTLKGILQELL